MNKSVSVPAEQSDEKIAMLPKIPDQDMTNVSPMDQLLPPKKRGAMAKS